MYAHKIPDQRSMGCADWIEGDADRLDLWIVATGRGVPLWLWGMIKRCAYEVRLMNQTGGLKMLGERDSEGSERLLDCLPDCVNGLSKDDISGFPGVSVESLRTWSRFRIEPACRGQQHQDNDGSVVGWVLSYRIDWIV